MTKQAIARTKLITIRVNEKVLEIVTSLAKEGRVGKSVVAEKLLDIGLNVLCLEMKGEVA